MRSPKEIIENIRRTRFEIGLDKKDLSENVKAALKDKEKILEGASQVVREINTKKPHFILELIQNAEDNDYEENIEPKIKFIIKSNELIIQNNEKGFSKKNVKALCGIGISTKRGTLGYIGEKGIGFKSVFMVADKVHIYSNGFQFGFNYDKSNPKTMIIPEWIDDDPNFVDPTQTNIVLYLKPGMGDEISEYFKEIHPSLLLFLRKLKVIEIKDEIHHKYEKIELHKKNGKIEIVYGGKKSYWKIIKKTLEVPNDIKEDRRNNIDTTEMVLAFPLKEDGSPDVSSEQFVFAFLPIRRYGFNFIIQADFFLAAGREDLIKDNKWNKWLRDSIATVFLNAVGEFKTDEKLMFTFYNYLNFEEVKDDFFSPVAKQIYKNLQNTECILSETNVWKKPTDILIGDDDAKKLVPNKDLKNFFGKEYLSDKVKTKKSILRELGVNDFSIKNLIECLKNKEWVEKQNDEWFANLFEYLSKQYLSDETLAQLKKLKIIKLENEALASIDEGVIFFPLDKEGKGYGFEDELRIFKRDIINIITEREKKDKDLKILDFLKKLKIQRPNPYEIIEKHIIPIYEKDNLKQKSSDVLLGYVRYIKDNIDKYEKESNKEDSLKRLKKSILIRIVKDTEGKNWYAHPENIYLPKIYGNENDLETLFEGIDVNFVHSCYIEDILEKAHSLRSKLKGKGKKWKKKHKEYVKRAEEQLKKIEDRKNKQIKEWKEFFVKIGVNEIPKVIYYEGPISYEDKYPTSEEIEYSTYGDSIKDWRLSNEFEKLFDHLTPQKLSILLTLMDAYWAKKYSNYLKMEYEWFYYHERHKTLESSFIRDLKEKIRVPTTQNTLAKPSEVFVNKPEIREVLGDTVPYLATKIENEDFIKAIGINTEASVENVLNYLKALVKQKCKDKNKFEKLYGFLNKHFEDNEKSIRQSFYNAPLIYVPNTEKMFFTIHEVLWKDVSEVFGENRAYLEKHYSKLKYFFVEKLGVSEKPSPKDYADVLVDLSEKDEIIDEDKQVILKIYEELNEHLNPDNVDEPISEEGWWGDFINKSIFFVENNKFWHNEGNVLINDNQELYNLFKNREEIAFLWLPPNYHPAKIKFFIEASELQYLSKVVEVIPDFDESSCSKHEGLTKKILDFIPYILRYLYWKEYREYENLKKNKFFEKIKNLEVYTIDKLQVKYSINNMDVSTTALRNCLLYENKLYISKEFENNTDYIAIELSKLFGEIRGLDTFIISIFDKQTKEKIENLMEAKDIGELPQFEKKLFEDSLQIPKTGKLPEKPRDISTAPTRKVIESIQATEAHSSSVGKARDISIAPTSKIIETKPVTEGRFTSVGKARDISTAPTKKIIETEPLIEARFSSVEKPSSEIEREPKKWTPECTPEQAVIKVDKYEPKEASSQQSPSEGYKGKTLYRNIKPSTSPKPTPKQHDSLSEEDKKAIGRWGEEYALKCVKEEMVKKYPSAKAIDTDNGFVLKKDESIIVKATWLNKYNDRGIGYDIELIEGNIKYYIEVKSTITEGKDWFNVSKDQWELMQREGDKFWICRVYGVGTKNPRCRIIDDPARRWREGGIVASPIRIQI